MQQPGLFDLEERYSKLGEQCDPLEALNAAIAWSTFRPVLKKLQKKVRKSNAGRKPYDVILMFKALVLQSTYNLSDEQVEFQVRDRWLFMHIADLLIPVIEARRHIHAPSSPGGEVALSQTFIHTEPIT